MTETAIPKSFYIQILRDNGVIDEFSDLEILVPELHGDHFLSACDTVTAYRKNGGEPVELFVKREIANDGHAQRTKDVRVFEKEAGFFNSLLPDLKKFGASRTNSKAGFTLDIAPKCYFASDKLLVMENLAKRGYILLDKTKGQNLSQAKMVVKNLAKFHAPSYVLLSEETNPTELVVKYPCLTDYSMMETSSWFDGTFVPILRIAVRTLRAHRSEETGYALKVLGEIMTGLQATVRPYYALSDSDVCHVVNHGDCWNSNMLFLQDLETKELTKNIFIDFQMVRIGSPTLDLSYYMFTSLKPEVRRAEWTNLLNTYYDSLVENVEALKGKVTFPFEDLVADYRRKLFPGFIMGVCVNGVRDALKCLGNLEEVEGDLVEHIEKIVGQWIENNPDIVKRNAQEFGETFQEYKELISK